MFFKGMRKKSFGGTLALCLILFLSVYSAQEAAAKGGFWVSAKAAIFSNSTQVVRYYGKNVHKRVLPASTAKIMTALVVLERLSLDTVVSVSARAAKAQPSKIYARPGEKFKVRDLLYAILLKSANDASIVLAEAVAGSEWNFVQMMNAKAKKIGARHTRFANASGLPSKARQYSTPYDMYLIMREAVKNDFFRQAIQLKHKTIRSTSGRTFKLKSHNKILFGDWKHKIYGKTGWTRAAKSCFVGYVMKGKSICIIAIFGCESGRRWKEIKHIVSHYGGIAL